MKRLGSLGFLCLVAVILLSLVPIASAHDSVQGATESASSAIPESTAKGLADGVAPRSEVNVSALPEADSARTLGIPPPALLNGERSGREGPARASAQPSSQSFQTTISTSFDGLRYGDNSGISNTYFPPDVQLAVGPSHVVEMVNEVVGMWTKQGTSLQVVSLKGFFNTGNEEVGDPKVFYDSSSSRWFASVFHPVAGTVEVAVSQTGDPTGLWWIYTVTAAAGYCPDQPILAVSNDKVMISVNDFTSECTGDFMGVEYFALNKAEMVAGRYTYYTYWGPDTSLFSVHPAHVLSSSSDIYMVSVWARESSVVRLFSITGLPTETDLASSQWWDLPISPTKEPPAAPQLGSTYTLDPTDARVTDAFFRQSTLWFSFTEACTPSGDSQVRSCARLIQLDPSTRAVKQDFDIGVSGTYLLYPALSSDGQGNIVIVLGYSSSSSYPGLALATQPKESPPNSYSELTTLKSGSGPEAPGSQYCKSNVCRYGDYFGAVPDPSDGSVVWVAGEYGTSSGWRTHLASVSVTVTVVPLVMSYSIQGGGIGFSPPVLSYTFLGTARTATLTSTPTTYSFDAGTSWSVSETLAGSTQTERWQTNQEVIGFVTTSGTFAFNYYHQYSISVSYSLVGGGTPAAPSIQYSYFGESNSVELTASSQGLWVDTGTYSVTATLGGSTQQERWYAPTASGSVSGPGTIAVAYYHQYYLEISGGNISSQWYNSGDIASVTVPRVFARSNGQGFRTTSYALDQQLTTVPPTAESTTLSILMDRPHTLAVGAVRQYEVALDQGAIRALSSITAPTIAGDDYWYDSGSQVTAALNGIWGRSSGRGESLIAFAINGGSETDVATSGTVVALSVSISSPQAITTQVVEQFELVQASGSLVSVTQFSILGDTGWYDSGTQVEAVYDYSWDASDHARSNAVAYSIDGSESRLDRVGSGTFTVSLKMDGPHTISIRSVMQYRFTISGGHDIVVTSSSPTGDGFFDSGTSTRVSTANTWNVVGGSSRENLASYTLDGTTVGIARAEAGNYVTPAIEFNEARTLTFNSMTQYYLELNFTDNSGSREIVPTAVKIDLQGVGMLKLNGSSIWIDNGAKFELASVIWESTDIKPSDLTQYSVTAPVRATVSTRVYDLTLKVTDPIGIPVSGAEARITLVNGSLLVRASSSDGTVTVPLIPLGKFNATISLLGASTQVVGDVSNVATVQGTVPLSYPILGIAGVVAAVVVVAVLLLRRRGITKP